jgi:uncharacterized protein YecT (DUF1311 family)
MTMTRKILRLEIGKLGSAVALLIALSVAQSSAQDAPEVDCENAMAQQDMNYCAEMDFRKSDAELNRVYKKAIKSARDADKSASEMGPDYVGAVDALKKAQRAWIDYRDGHCTGVGFEARGGSMEPMLVSGCKDQLTQSRTKELQELISGTGN